MDDRHRACQKMSIAVPLLLILLLSPTSTSTLATTSPSPQRPNPRLLDKSRCAPSDYPFLVTLFMFIYPEIRIEHARTCGGTLVTPLWVLTVAECTNFKQFKNYVVAGTGHLMKGVGEVFSIFIHEQPHQVREAVRVISHEKYKTTEKVKYNNDLRYDVGLMKVNASFDMTDKVRLAYLPMPGLMKDCKQLVGVGWDRSNYNVPRTLYCLDMQLYKGWCPNTVSCISLASHEKEDNFFCQAEAGNPLMCGDVVVGLLAGSPYCFKNNFTFYTNVEDFVPWIQEQGVYPRVKGSKVSAGSSCGLHKTLVLVLLHHLLLQFF